MTAVLTDEALVDLAFAALPDHQWAVMEAKLRRWHGFVEGDAVRDISDRPPHGLAYLTRTHEGQHQCLSLIYTHDRSRFLEAVLLVYERPYDARSKVRQTPLCARTLRGGLEEVLSAVATIYPSLPKP